MLTLFATPKPFRGHIGLIQRNALESWTRIHPGVEVILFGDDKGAAETCAGLGLHHEPRVECNEHGTKYLRSMFEPAQKIARHSLLCYVNCDIILTPAFADAVAQAAAAFPEFLLVGRRWDTAITEPVEFGDPEWPQQLESRARRDGRLQGPQWIDYFAFSRGLYTDIPSLVIGRVGWDNWLVWRARKAGCPVVDATPVVTAIHQNHDYGYHPQGAVGVWGDEQARRNYELAGGGRHYCTIEDATHLLTPRGLSNNRARHLVPIRRGIGRVRHGFLAFALRATRPARHALGLRMETWVRFRSWMKGSGASS
jgi:hypothetical protein